MPLRCYELVEAREEIVENVLNQFIKLGIHRFTAILGKILHMSAKRGGLTPFSIDVIGTDGELVDEVRSVRSLEDHLDLSTLLGEINPEGDLVFIA